VKTKVLFVINSLSVGGAERVFSTLLKNINVEKFEIILALGVKTDGFLSEVPEYVKVFELSGSKKALKSFFPLLKLILTEKPDIVFSTLGMVSASSLCSFFTKDIAYIARFGNTLSADLNRARRESYLKYLFQKVSYLLVLKRSHIITQSNYMKDDLLKYFSLKNELKVRVIYNPCPDSTVTFTSTEGKKHLVTIGRFAWQKGYDILIEALAMLKKDRNDFKFFFIGGGCESIMQKILLKSNSLGLANNVEFLGERIEPFSCVENIDLFVSSSRFEGFANVILESLANGIPVVATNCPSGNREIINDSNGWLTNQKGFEPTPKEIYDSLSIGLNNLDNLNREKIKQDINKRFSVKSIVSQYENLFLEIKK